MSDSDDIKDDELDPDAPEFERMMLNEPEPDSLEHMAVDDRRYRIVMNSLIGLLNRLPAHVEDLMYLEVLMALSTVYGSVAERLLAECDFETWHEHRNKVLELVGITSGYINGLYPTVDQLAQAEVTETTH